MGIMHSTAVAVLVAATGLAGMAGPWAGTQTPAGAVFTADQAAAGEKQYQARCASCHAPDLGGRDDAPALTGDAFMATWGAQTTKDLYDFVSSTMPPDGASLTDDEMLAVVAHMLQRNGAAAGAAPLTAATAVRVDAVTKPQ